MMNYDEAVQYLNNLNSLGSIPGTKTIRELLFRLCNPHENLPIVHIAGTNGKGSVGTVITGILRAQGYHVGRFTSPAVFEDLEIITCDDERITPSQWAESIDAVKVANDQMLLEGKQGATRFEQEFAAAMVFFHSQKELDYILIECGMGGLLDATNVFEQPLLSVITRIDYDHIKFLGESLSEIATQKAGILKANCAGIYLASQPESDLIIKQRADELKVQPLFCCTRDALADSFYQKIKDQLSIGFKAEYQVENILLGMEAASYLLSKHPSASANSLIKNASDLLMQIEALAPDYPKALSSLYWPGRFEYLHHQPDIILDGAHNPNGVAGLCKSLTTIYPQLFFTFVLGVFADKHYPQELEMLVPLAKSIHCIETPHHERALKAKELAQFIRMHYDIDVALATSIEEELSNIYEQAKGSDVIVICGSLSHLKYAKAFTTEYYNS